MQRLVRRFGGGTDADAIEAPAERPEGIVLPQVDGDSVRLELGDGLTIHVHAHALDAAEGAVPCWTLVTHGLASPRQLATTVRRDRGVEPRGLVAFVLKLNELCIGGAPPRIGDHTGLHPVGPLLQGPARHSGARARDPDLGRAESLRGRHPGVQSGRAGHRHHGQRQ